MGWKNQNRMGFRPCISAFTMRQSSGQKTHAPHHAAPSGKFSFFNGATSTNPAGTLTLAALVERIRTCPDLARKTARVRELQGNARKEAKRELPAVTFGGVFSYRANDKLTAYSWLLVIDFDDVPDAPGLREAVASHPCCLLAFVSPSGNGVKAVFRLDTGGLDTSDVDAVQAFHRRAFNALQADCEARYGVKVDPSGKDVSRLCFLSFDPDVRVNEAPDAFLVPAPPPAPPRTAPALVPSAVRRGAGLSLPTWGADATRAIADLTRLCEWVRETGTDLTADYGEWKGYEYWYRIPLALARSVRSGELPEPFARKAFHALSANSPQYTHRECERKFSDGLRDADKRTTAPVTLRSVFHFAKERGYVPVNRTATDGTVDDDRVIRVKRYASDALDELETRIVPGVRLLLQAPTGTGKTTAVFALARRLVDAGTFRRVWVLVPYRNLAKQIEKEYGVPGVYGGVGGADVRAARAGDVLVTTYDGLAKLGGVPPGTLLVVDESHELVDSQGFRKEALKLVTKALDAALESDGAFLYTTATPGEHFADAFGLSVLKIIPEHVNRKTVAVYPFPRYKDRRAACFSQLVTEALAEPEKAFVLFLNDRADIKAGIRYAIDRGVPADGIVEFTANADGPAVRALLTDNRFPAGVRLVFATKALGAGYNVLNENIGGVFYCVNRKEGLRPNDAAQFTARFRNVDGLPVHVFAGETKKDARDAGKTTADLMSAERWKAEKAIEARRLVDLSVVNDFLPSVRLDPNAQAVERTTDPDKGVCLRINEHRLLYRASERRNHARTIEDFISWWGQYDPGAMFDVRRADAPETLALLKRIADELKEAANEARETVSAWTVEHAMAVGYACVQSLRTDIRRYAPNARDAAKDVSEKDKALFLEGGGPLAVRRHLSGGELPGFPPAKLWQNAVLLANPNKWGAWKRRIALVLQRERLAGRLGDVELFDQWKAADFLLWEAKGLPAFIRLTGKNGVNITEAYEAVRPALGGLTLKTFQDCLLPLYFDMGERKRAGKRDDGTRPWLYFPRGLSAAQQKERYAQLCGLEKGEYEHFIERLKERRKAAATEARLSKADATKERAAERENERLPVPLMAARLGADNAVAVVTFANDPPDDEPCPY